MKLKERREHLSQSYLPFSVTILVMLSWNKKAEICKLHFSDSLPVEFQFRIFYERHCLRICKGGEAIVLQLQVCTSVSIHGWQTSADVPRFPGFLLRVTYFGCCRGLRSAVAVSTIYTFLNFLNSNSGFSDLCSDLSPWTFQRLSDPLTFCVKSPLT